MSQDEIIQEATTVGKFSRPESLILQLEKIEGDKRESEEAV